MYPLRETLNMYSLRETLNMHSLKETLNMYPLRETLNMPSLSEKLPELVVKIVLIHHRATTSAASVTMLEIKI